MIKFILGLNVCHKENLPTKGPALLVSNHNSHLDAVVLMSLYPLSYIHKVRPIAAADYFIQKKSALSWLAQKCIHIIPIERGNGGKDAFQEFLRQAQKALDNKEIVIFFPEGSRGEPEKMKQLKKGIFHLIKENEDIPVTPIMLHGLGRALPKGEKLLVPFNCDVVIGEPISKTQNAETFIENLNESFTQLAKKFITKSQQ